MKRIGSRDLGLGIGVGCGGWVVWLVQEKAGAYLMSMILPNFSHEVLRYKQSDCLYKPNVLGGDVS